MPETLKQSMGTIGKAAKEAAQVLANASTDAKNKALKVAAETLREQTEAIVQANHQDMAAGEEKDMSLAMLDRLKLDRDRINNMADGLDAIEKLDDPIGHVMDTWVRPNRLSISRVRVPLGVIGVIYESRPNVTADAGSLCLKSGNASILRGGSESFHSCEAIFNCLKIGLDAANLPPASIQIVPTTDRAAVGEMLIMTDFIDVIIPRGGRSLVERVQTEAKVPVFGHLEGICHTYVNAESSPGMARDIVVNAKMRRPGICGATETLLIDRAVKKTHLSSIIKTLYEAGCEIRGEIETMALDDRVIEATEEDWSTEYLDAIISIRQVDGVRDAIDHVNFYGTEHTDAIITDNDVTANTFLNGINSAIAIHNASTQFADGGEFGMGAEIGISTGKMHARGPVGVEQLTTFKYVVRGDGQTRL
jgi:glutamate-5-semialdehyde dehydrogenase